jgi:glycosyltransferase involved in cell wall biosynthesis
MLGRNPGYVTTQGLILADRFAAAGYRVLSTSSVTNRYLRLLDILWTLIRCCRRIDFQCLEVYSGPSFVVADLSSWLGKCLGQRIVMTLHGGGLPEFMARHPRWACRVLGRADALVTPSLYLARAVGKYGFHAEVIPNVVDLSDLPYQHRKYLRPRLFWMRSFHPIWNPEMAVRVLARLRQDVPAATLVMAGQDKGSRAEVERLAKRLRLEGAVYFPGFLDAAGKVREGSAADIFLVTNRVDNMPVAVVEACAMGLPVVATAVGGIPDLLTDQETGLLTPDNDEEAMAGAIRQLLGDPDLAARLSTNARRLAVQSSWEQVRPRWEQLFAEVMARRGLGKMSCLRSESGAASLH